MMDWIKILVLILINLGIITWSYLDIRKGRKKHNAEMAQFREEMKKFRKEK